MLGREANAFNVLDALSMWEINWSGVNALHGAPYGYWKKGLKYKR